MGNAIYTRLVRPFRSFNIESRTERILSREKPIPAPQHSSVKKQMEIVDKVNPNFMENHYKKDAQLDDHLKRVFVQSIDPEGKPETERISSRPLPKHGREFLREDHDFDKPCKGKCSLKTAIEFIHLYNENPIENSTEKISQNYQLDKKIVENIVTNFKIFKVLEHKANQQPGK